MSCWTDPPRTSSARLSPFFSTDVRIDKTWELRRFDLVGYLEIQNATFAQNPEYMAWNFDYSEERPFVSSPPLPVFGLRGEF